MKRTEGITDYFTQQRSASGKMDFTKFAPSKFKGNFKENAQRWFDTYECFANLYSWDEITFCTAFPLF